jgi:hypothetical protein
MRTKQVRDLVNKAAAKVRRGGREVGYVYFQQKDGTTKKIPFTDATGEIPLMCTQEDIDGATCGDPFNCVMARMFRRAFGPLCTEVRVGKKYIHVVQGKGSYANSIRFACKGKLKKAIHTFDISKGHHGFTPGETYVLSKPAPQDERNARPNRRDLYQNGTSGKGMQRLMNKRPIAPTRNIMCFLPPSRKVA